MCFGFCGPSNVRKQFKMLPAQLPPPRTSVPRDHQGRRLPAEVPTSKGPFLLRAKSQQGPGRPPLISRGPAPWRFPTRTPRRPWNFWPTHGPRQTGVLHPSRQVPAIVPAGETPRELSCINPPSAATGTGFKTEATANPLGHDEGAQATEAR